MFITVSLSSIRTLISRNWKCGSTDWNKPGIIPLILLLEKMSAHYAAT